MRTTGGAPAIFALAGDAEGYEVREARAVARVEGGRRPLLGRTTEAAAPTDG